MVKTQRAERRSSALSKERIVEAAIDILDAEGDGGLTFRALAARLATGAGAIYWHVENKDDLLVAAAEAVISRVMTDIPTDLDPAAAIRAIACGVFDAVDAHPWVGMQLFRQPAQSAMLQFYEGIGQQLLRFNVPDRALFACQSALVLYVLGVAGQNAASARIAQRDRLVRSEFLESAATRWLNLDPEKYPFSHRMAEALRDHDDREQFLAGIDLILAGIRTVDDTTTPGAG